MHDTRRILLIGATGQVGAELLRILQPLGEVVSADLRDTPLRVDLSDHANVREVVREVKPGLIVNAAAYTAVDKAEQESALAMQVNGVAPGILAEEAKSLGALLVHYSTDYVFHGRHQRPYLESDVAAPLNVYGESKLAGDQAIQAVAEHYLIFRTSWVYGPHGQNFLRTIQRLAQEREELRIVSDQIGAPTWSRLIAEATAQVLGQVFSPNCHADLGALSGLYNLTCGGETSWHGFAQAIIASLPKQPRVLPIPTSDYPTPAQRPAYSVLNNDKLAATFGVRLPVWDKALALCLKPW
jgi:dTDP-4-dehydrorhamnose reductase